MRPYYQDEWSTIYHGDCREVRGTDLGHVRCAVFSPPYNVGIDYADHDDAMSWDDYWHLADSTCSFLDEVCADGARIWCNVMPNAPERLTGGTYDGGPGAKGGHAVGRIDLTKVWSRALEHPTRGFHYRDTIVWLQDSFDGGCAWGSWQSPAGPNLRGGWEAILLYHRRPWLRTPPAGLEGWRDSVDGDRWQDLCSNVWRIPPTQRTSHPAPYPLELASRCIRLSTWPGEVVIDPFMGSGTTLVAARALGRKAIGIEISERYCEIAAKRLAQEVLDFGGVA